MSSPEGFEKYLKRIVQEAVTSAQHTSTPPNDDDKLSGSNDESRPLGEEDRFWKIKETPEKEDDEEIYYSTFDKTADDYVKELTKGLNDQLDNLLLFAALFSGINSAFIVFSLPSLNDPFQGLDHLINLLVVNGNNVTADPLAQKILNDENSPTALNVAVNILFASSLICSLITAFFAVVGKQWLSYLAEESNASDERTRRTKMQNKVIGIQHYRLRALLDAYLTTTLQIALFLFIIGLILFLYTFNKIVAGFVIGFAGAGLSAYVWSAYLALRDPTCPFQTPVTRTLLPGLFSIYFNTAYALVALGNSAKILLKNKFKRMNRQPIHNTSLHPGGDNAPGKQPDTSDVFEIQWDRRDAVRRKVADYLQVKREDGHINIEAACWMVHTAENEMVARIAALMLLNQTNREYLSFVAKYGNTTRRLRGVISVTDEVLQKEANLSADIKEREWKKLCFYIQVLSHIFAGHPGMDAAQCQVMDWIYEYQKNRSQGRLEYSHTYVPSRMVGVIKLLLLHFEKHYSGMGQKRQIILTERLYQAPFEPNCSSKALSLAAFAMKALPKIALKEKDQTIDEKLHTDLWNSYLEAGPDVLRDNFLGAVTSYMEYKHTGGLDHILPSDEQLQKLFDCMIAKNQGEAYVITFNARAEVIYTLAKLLPILPLDLPLYHSALQLLQSEQNRIVRFNDLAKWKAEDRAELAEACFKLAGGCSDIISAHEAAEKSDPIYKTAQEIWWVCYEDVLRSASGSPSSSPVEIISHLRMATALLWAADPKLERPQWAAIGDGQRGKLDSIGLQWVRHVSSNPDDATLANDLSMTSDGARAAFSYFLQHLADGNPPAGSEKEFKFAEKYLSLCRSRNHGECRSVKALDGAVSRWKNALPVGNSDGR